MSRTAPAAYEAMDSAPKDRVFIGWDGMRSSSAAESKRTAGPP